MRVHRQTQRRLVDDDAVREVLRRRMRCGLPTDAKTTRNLGIACGSCRHSRLRREVERELAALVPRPARIVPILINGDPGVRAASAPVAWTGNAPPKPEIAAVPVAPPNVSFTMHAARPTESEHTGREAPTTPGGGGAGALLGHLYRAAGQLTLALLRRFIARRWWQSPQRTPSSAR
jgi:hypothetical protein